LANSLDLGRGIGANVLTLLSKTSYLWVLWIETELTRLDQQLPSGVDFLFRQHRPKSQGSLYFNRHILDVWATQPFKRR